MGAVHFTDLPQELINNISVEGESDLYMYIHMYYNDSILCLQDDFDDYDKDDENCCYIPQEVVLAYQYQREQVQRQREQLRATLRQNFERLCLQRGVHIANAAAHSTGH